MPSPDENFPHKNDRTFHQRCLSRARDKLAETPLAPAKADTGNDNNRRPKLASGNKTYLTLDWKKPHSASTKQPEERRKDSYGKDIMNAKFWRNV